MYNLGMNQIYYVHVSNTMACLLHTCSFAVRSCSCCIHLSLKMQKDSLQVGWSYGKSGMHHNSIQGEQITP